MNASVSRTVLVCTIVLLAARSSAQVTEIATVHSDGGGGNGESGTGPGSVLSADGRLLVFVSSATNLAEGDLNDHADVFVRDLLAGTTRIVSVGMNGAQSDGNSLAATISGNGRFVVFASFATNLVPGDTNGAEDVFVNDLQTGQTTAASVSSSGSIAGGDNPSISDDGRYVAFRSFGNDLVPGDTNNAVDDFVRDLETGTTERVSVGAGATQGNGGSYHPTISGNGRYVAFLSKASNLVPGDTNGQEDVFVRDRVAGTTERVSVASDGSQGNNGLDFVDGPARPGISTDGRYVEFLSTASNFAVGDTNGAIDVFVHDRVTGSTERVNVGWNGMQAQGTFTDAWMSADGRFVAFTDPVALVPGDVNGLYDVFVRDVLLGTTEIASVSTAGEQGDENSSSASISADGRFVVFDSAASNLAGGPTNGLLDAFVRDRAASGAQSFCHPGIDSVVGCPCGNPPSQVGRGCDNSAATGGATLVASGSAYLSSDGLVLTTSGEKPTALSTVWQGASSSVSGVVYGQGVRCVNGALKRLFNRSAVGGSISVPAVGDPTISTRSAALGVPITPGQSRFYAVSYRDPVVLHGCASDRTFNTTQAVRVAWRL